ncbi:autoinducer-2 kinase [Agreia pratensis]|uniref:FGGY family carbohydrate kinase n=1 Tax=Microbacteriaceae TaxID=85023 RepID=UPI00188C66B5|nr:MULTISPECIES: FGGY family carbohydrate kinase [Microbacteriaceae]MBF4561214.1 autoinducer-2 kinase [Microbacterium sp. VKM Ac-2870]MBF4633898.1 autoinducer-2 kinase [Agreia pratensis]
MTSPVVIAVDAGTGSARALAFNLEGTLVARAQREWTHAAVSGFPGGADFDTAGGWSLISSALREVVGKLDGREILALGASSMREGFVLYDAHGVEIFACPNTDGRARSQADELVTRGVADRIYELGGDWVSITAPSRLVWLLQERPDVMARARHLGMLSDWVTYRLTGAFSTDPTCGSSSALFDLTRRDWSDELAGLVGIDRSLLPPVVECGEVVGTVSIEAAAATGLPVGLPVTVGGADTQLALHGIGATSDRPTIVAGTFWQTTAVVDSPIIDPQRRLRTLCHVGTNSWMVEGIGFLSGLVMRWFRDALAPESISAAAQLGTSPFDVIEGWALDVPRGSNGLVAVMANAMRADAWHHAAPAFVGIDINDPTAFGRGAFARSIEEAAAYVARAHLEILDDLTDSATTRGGHVDFTGGSSNGRLWPQVIAEVTGLTTDSSVVPEATSFGAARLAASAVGEQIAPASAVERSVVPEAGAIAEYDVAYARWQRVYAAQTEATAQSGMNPLFTPPGGLAHRPFSSPTPKRMKQENHHG